MQTSGSSCGVVLRTLALCAEDCDTVTDQQRNGGWSILRTCTRPLKFRLSTCSSLPAAARIVVNALRLFDEYLES